MTDDNDTNDEEPDEELPDEGEDINLEEIAEQEWTLGGEAKRHVIEFKGMKFVVEDPDDDSVLNMMAQAEQGQGDTSDRMFQLVKSAVVEPEITPERWRDLRTSERIGLMVRVSEAIGLGDMMDFPEGGQEVQQA